MAESGLQRQHLHPKVTAWFDTSCFVTPSEYQFGNEGRNVLLGGRIDNLDLSAHREFHLPTPRETALQLRFEAFNALNHPQFAQPGSTVGTTPLVSSPPHRRPIERFR